MSRPDDGVGCHRQMMPAYIYMCILKTLHARNGAVWRWIHTGISNRTEFGQFAHTPALQLAFDPGEGEGETIVSGSGRRAHVSTPFPLPFPHSLSRSLVPGRSNFGSKYRPRF